MRGAQHLERRSDWKPAANAHLRPPTDGFAAALLTFQHGARWGSLLLRASRLALARSCHGSKPVGVLAALVVAIAPQGCRRTTIEDGGRAAMDMFYNGEIEELWKLFSPKLRDHYGSTEALRAFRDRAIEFLGAETRILEERDGTRGRVFLYVRTSKFERYEHPVETYVRLDAARSVTGFRIMPTEFLAYRPTARMRVPFSGSWLVLEGGRGINDNFHPGFPTTTFAYDFQRLVDGKAFSGKGERNEDYFSFGTPVLAPAAGTIIKVVNDVSDHTPGERDHEDSKGNFIVIDHGNDELSFLSKLKMGSITLKPGDAVETGQSIGLVGNSGHAKKPHLHYHLQNRRGQGLPAVFDGYAVRGEITVRGEPKRGQVIEAR